MNDYQDFRQNGYPHFAAGISVIVILTLHLKINSISKISCVSYIDLPDNEVLYLFLIVNAIASS